MMRGVSSLVTKHYEKYFGEIVDILTIQERYGWTHYKIIGTSGSIMLRRFDRMMNEEAVQTLIRVQSHVQDAGVFNDSGLNHCLSLLPTRTGRPYIQVERSSALAFPDFPADLGYYPGTLPAMRSVAYRLGQVERALASLPGDIDFDALCGERHKSWTLLDDDRLNEIIGHNAQSANTDVDRHNILTHRFNENIGVILRSMEYLRDQGTSEPAGTPILNGLHPHNTYFTRGDTCALIVDYQMVHSQWSRNQVLAFAAHRFAREVIRRTGTAEALKDHLDTFVEEFQRGGGVVLDDFKRRFIGEIIAVNLGKLCSIMEYTHNIRGDKAKRPQAVIESEGVKFLGYLLEIWDMHDERTCQKFCV